MKIKERKRLLVAVSPSDESSLRVLAKTRKQPLATVASDLLSKALELEEDQTLAELAVRRHRRKGVRYVSHTAAWTRLMK